jgi:hypothetical protein
LAACISTVVASGDEIMTIPRLMTLLAVALPVSTSSGFAGPCSLEIDRMQTRIDAKVNAIAAAGPTASESTAATTDRQPTPGSIAAAEERLGELSPDTIAAVAQAMTRARAADSANNKSACEQALADVQRALGP